MRCKKVALALAAAVMVYGFLADGLQAGPFEEEGVSQTKPNIVFIFSDDHAYQAIGAYGSQINRTPNLDRLASQGMRFDRCLVTNSICGPARAVILTGKYSHLNGFRQNGDKFNGSQQTFPKLMRSAGYQTAVVGKWHLGSDPTGFDHWFVLPGQGNYYNPDFLTPNGRKQVSGYVTDVTTDHALKWLDDRNQDKPFMLMLQHKAPHRAWLPSKDHLQTFEKESITEPSNLLDDYSGRAEVLAENAMEVGKDMRPGFDLKLFPDPESDQAKRFFRRFTPEQKSDWIAAYKNRNDHYLKYRESAKTDDQKRRLHYQYYIKDYLRCISSVDDNVGRVLDYLKQNSLEDNTIVIYSSDQGFYLGEHGWYDKRWIFEESLRTPLIIRWPGLTEPGSHTSQIVSNLDFPETFLDAAGIEIPADMQGRSLKPILAGQHPSDWRQSFYYHYYELGTHNVAAHYGVVTERYKLIHYYRKIDRENGRAKVNIDQWDLMDRLKDPNENMSFINDPLYEETRAELKVELQRLRDELKVSSN